MRCSARNEMVQTESVAVGVAYGSNLRRARDVIRDAVSSVAGRVDDRAVPMAHVTSTALAVAMPTDRPAIAANSPAPATWSDSRELALVRPRDADRRW